MAILSIAIRANGDFDVSNSQAEQYAREDGVLSRSTLADMVGQAARLFRSLADTAIGLPDQRGTQELLAVIERWGEAGTAFSTEPPKPAPVLRIMPHI